MAKRKTPELFELIIVTPDKLIFEAKARRIMAPGVSQEIAILPDHTPLYAKLSKGNLTVTTETNQVDTHPVEGGIVRVKGNRVSVITGF